MIKRSGALFLSLLYLITVVGFALNLHFCGDNITAVKINPAVVNAGGCSDIPMKCCTNKHLVVKIKDAHQGQVQSLLSTILPLNISNFLFPDVQFSQKVFLTGAFYIIHSPDPPLCSVNAVVKNCVFRI